MLGLPVERKVADRTLVKESRLGKLWFRVGGRLCFRPFNGAGRLLV